MSDGNDAGARGATAMADREGTGRKGLKLGAIGLASTVVIGVASTAPGYSLAATLGFVNAEVGLQAPAIMWLAFVPMLFIASAYYYLNRGDPDCGTTFTWATKAMGPKTGWMGGWGIFVADLVVMPLLAGITGVYFFLLLGANGLATNEFWIVFVGCIFIAVMTLITWIGIELSARTQVGLLAAELIVLVIFAAVALYKVYFDDPANSVDPSLSWLNPFKVGDRGALIAGLLLAVFIYWGWDSAVTVNEETDDVARTPGLAAVLSTLILLGIYVVVSVAAQAYAGSDFLVANSDDVLSAVGKDVLGSGFDKFLIIAVLTSAAASTQTTILPTARTALSMAVHKAAPDKLGDVHPRYLTPTWATLGFGAISIAWYIGLSIVSDDVLADSLVALGFMIAFYYGLTGFACVIYYRRVLFKSVRNFLFIGLSPFLGGAMLTYIFWEAWFYYADPANSSSGKEWLNVGPPLVIGVALILFGVPLMLLWLLRAPEFFRRKREVATEKPG
ncbi:MAG: APC family permease [Actinomycetota bacterium]